MMLWRRIFPFVEHVLTGDYLSSHYISTTMPNAFSSDYDADDPHFGGAVGPCKPGSTSRECFEYLTIEEGEYDVQLTTFNDGVHGAMITE